MRSMTPVWAVVGASVASLFLSACGGTADAANAAQTPELRKTSLGIVQGSNDTSRNGTYAWKGLPYAKAPVGPLRWKAPVVPDAWSGTRDARTFGHACLQNGPTYGPGANNTYNATIASTLNTPVGNEDCLTLNIWRPAHATPKLPVIAFVYGGSNVSGYTADPVYDGATLARTANAVVAKPAMT